MSVTKPTITKRKKLEENVNLCTLLESTKRYYNAFTESYITFYESWAKAEDAFSDTEYKKGYDTVAKILTRMVNPNETVIDIGCGVGVWSALLAEHGAHVISVDYALNPLERCKERARAVKMESRISTVLADGFHLPFRDHTFDGAVLNWVIAHIVKSQNLKFMKEVSRVIKEKGWLVVSDSYWRGQKGGKEQIQVRDTNKGSYELYKYYYEPEELCDLITEGFGNCYVETTTYELICVARKG